MKTKEYEEGQMAYIAWIKDPSGDFPMNPYYDLSKQGSDYHQGWMDAYFDYNGD